MTTRISLLFALALVFAFSGCGDSPEPVTEGTGIEGIGSVEELETAHRSGMIQLEGASARLTEAYDEARRLQQELQPSQIEAGESEAIQEIIDYIDSAAGSLAEAAYDPPSAAQLQSESAKFDELRLSTIQAANDAHFEVSSAYEISNGIGVTNPEYEELSFRLMMALQDIEGLIEALGGSLESEAIEEDF